MQTLNQREIELNHRQIVYEESYTTLAWKIISHNCSVSQILSYTPCQQNNNISVTTNEMKIIFPSESFKNQTTGEFIDFEISGQPSDECPRLLDRVRFNGKPELLDGLTARLNPFSITAWDLTLLPKIWE